jgi:cytochrome c556
MSKTITLALISVALLTACGDQAKDNHPQQLVSKRQAIFKKFTKALEPMGLVARGRQDYIKAQFVSDAQQLQALSGQPWAFFTPEGNYPPTRAKAEVWSQTGEFRKAQDNYLAVVDQLMKVADSGDMPRISSAVEAVQKSCKTCHDQFRSETAIRQ